MTTPYVRTGMGVPRPVDDDVEPERQDVMEEEPVVSSGELWQSEPSFSDQLVKYPMFCKLGAVVTRVFKLSDQQDTDALNQLMAGTMPEGAPSILVMPGTQVQWSESLGSFVELVKYRPVLYKRIIRKT